MTAVVKLHAGSLSPCCQPAQGVRFEFEGSQGYLYNIDWGDQFKHSGSTRAIVDWVVSSPGHADSSAILYRDGDPARRCLTARNKCNGCRTPVGASVRKAIGAMKSLN